MGCRAERSKGKVSEGKDNTRVGEKGLSFRAILHWVLFFLWAKKRGIREEKKNTHKGSRKRTSVRVHYRATDCAKKYRRKRQILYVEAIPSIAKGEGLWKAQEESAEESSSTGTEEKKEKRKGKGEGKGERKKRKISAPGEPRPPEEKEEMTCICA